MSPVQKQRIIGAILLLSALTGIALFLMSNASSPTAVIEQELVTTEPDYVSVVEAIPEGDIEVVDEHLEVLVDTDKGPSHQTTTNVEPQIKPAADRPVSSDEIDAIAEQLEQKVVKTTTAVTQANPDLKQSPQWILQVASFSVRDNADKLNKKLQAVKYPSYIDPVTTSSGKVIYRVRIGPQSDKAKLEQMAIKLKQNFQLQSQLLQQSN